MVNPSMIFEEDYCCRGFNAIRYGTVKPKFVKGFTTNVGGRTSHSAIMARSMEIPAVVRTKMATDGNSAWRFSYC